MEVDSFVILSLKPNDLLVMTVAKLNPLMLHKIQAQLKEMGLYQPCLILSDRVDINQVPESVMNQMGWYRNVSVTGKDAIIS